MLNKLVQKGITYTNEMKQYAISESAKGRLSSEIFEKAGFDLSITGRPLERELSLEE